VTISINGFRVQRFKVQGSGFKGSGVQRFRVLGSGFKGSEVLGSRFCIYFKR